MQFEYPGFLYFLLLALIPVIIHLFNLRKSKRVVFSNIKFLEEVKSASKSKTKVQRWLILLSRVLFVVFLVFAFAQPKVVNPRNVLSLNEKYIYIDNSLSMQLNKGEGERLELIKNVLLNSIDKNSEYTILTNARASQNGTGGELEENISQLNYTNQHRNIGSILNKLNDVEPNSSVYIFSDFQKGFFDAKELSDSLPYDLSLIPLESSGESNVYVDTLWLDIPFPQQGQIVKLTVRLKNSGSKVNKAVSVKLRMNEVQQGATLIELKGNESREISFDINLDKQGYNIGSIFIEDGGLHFDNEFYFTINTSNKIRVAVVSDKSMPYVSQVYTDTLFYLNTYSIQESQTVDFNRYDLVVLDELSDIPDFLIEKLLRSDAALMFFPSNKEKKLQSYKDFFRALEIGSVVYNDIDTSSVDVSNTVASPDFENPFFSGFFEKEDANMEMPYAKPLFSVNTEAIHLLTTKSGLPVISLVEGKKKVFLWTISLDKSFSNVPQHALFLPIMFKCAILSADIESKLYHTYDENLLVFKGDYSDYRDQLKLYYQEKELANAKISPVKMLFELPSQNLPSGVYQVGTKDSIFYDVAINYGKEESEMIFTSTEELNEFAKSHANIEVKPLSFFENEIGGAIGNKNTAFPYWKICLILSLIFLLTETILIRINK